MPAVSLFTHWKWTYILDSRPWRWSALDMSYMDKRGLREKCKGNFYFSKLDGVGNNFRSWFEKFRFIFVGATPEGAGLWARPHSTPLWKVCRGGLASTVLLGRYLWNEGACTCAGEWVASEIPESWMLLAHHGKEGDCFSLKDLLNLTCFLSIFHFFTFLFVLGAEVAQIPFALQFWHLQWKHTRHRLSKL